MVTLLKFKTPYDAGYDAGMKGGNTFNSHFSFFKTKESMKEWQRGNDDGSRKREAQRRESRGDYDFGADKYNH